MDRNSLLKLVIDKDKRIQELEKSLEDQKRLRLQDSSQVEEKAAKIKEWVTNKLKELENQNKQLRDQNKKQRETIESLNAKLTQTTPISTPRRSHKLASDVDKVQYIDHASPINTIDVNKSLKSRRPQLKKSITAVSSSSFEDESQDVPSRLDSCASSCHRIEVTNFSPMHLPMQEKLQSIVSNSTGRSVISIGGSQSHSIEPRQESPLYDSVNLEHLHLSDINSTMRYQLLQDNAPRQPFDKSTIEQSQSPPPPPPPHQSNRWELQLYDLVDQTMDSLVEDRDQGSQDRTSRERNPDPASRKSSSSAKNELTALVNPSFTTIDGDQVVEDFGFESMNSDDQNTFQRNGLIESFNRRTSNDHSSQSSVYQTRPRNDSVDLNEPAEKPIGNNLFDSPMRSRSSKDNILRTQSVRKNPAPEKLYDFISADLIKRGHLTKISALKNHHRWFVLKNFNLHAYKRETDETNKSTPLMTLKIDPSFQVVNVSQTNDSNFPFKIAYQDKTIQLVADSAQIRDEWLRILTVTINMSDVEPDSLTKSKSTYEGIMSVTRHGHTKRCHAILVSHVVFFLKSLTDPTPMSYMSVKEAKIREVTDSYDYDSCEHEHTKKINFQDCSLAIYPKFSMNLDPVYLTLGCQQETDNWFYSLSLASGVDQAYGTEFEKALTRLMVNNSVASRKSNSGSIGTELSGCQWRDQTIMLYSDKPITQPLTSLPNETLQAEAIESFKSILLFTQVPLEPVAIDYHVCLLQNCLGRTIKHAGLRNEFYAQLIKQSTYILHRCSSPKLSSSSSGCSSNYQRSSVNSLSPSSSECQFVTDIQLLGALNSSRNIRVEVHSTLSQLNSLKDRGELNDEPAPPSQSELLQIMQILAVAVSLNIPRGRMRWWLVDHLRKFANPDTSIGKYALYTLQAIERTATNGPRDNIPSRTEIMSILLRNPYDHSKPHSIPVSFSDGSYVVVEADGSTTVEELMLTMSRTNDIRHSHLSDFYLFADDPAGKRDLHILEPQRKVFDVVGWWEHTFKQHNSGRYQNTKTIKLTCRKRLPLRAEPGETDRERLLIVHQVNQEVVQQRLPLSKLLCLELGALMAQLTYGDYDDSMNEKLVVSIFDKVYSKFMPNKSSQSNSEDELNRNPILESELVDRWLHLSGKSAQECVRVYLNCIRRLKPIDN